MNLYSYIGNGRFERSKLRNSGFAESGGLTLEHAPKISMEKTLALRIGKTNSSYLCRSLAHCHEEDQGKKMAAGNEEMPALKTQLTRKKAM